MQHITLLAIYFYLTFSLILICRSFHRLIQSKPPQSSLIRNERRCVNLQRESSSIRPIVSGSWKASSLISGWGKLCWASLALSLQPERQSCCVSQLPPLCPAHCQLMLLLSFLHHLLFPSNCMLTNSARPVEAECPHIFSFLYSLAKTVFTFIPG